MPDPIVAPVPPPTLPVQPTTTALFTHRILLTAVIVGLIAFLWPLADLVASLNNWTEWSQPAAASKLIKCVIPALVAIGAALGLDLTQVLRK